MNEAKLYLVATPIGNLSDMSPRAVETLKSVDFIAAEDTRGSGVLLKHFDIKTPMISYHEHNEQEKSEEIVRRILGGESCAVITDAGMPAISDPGQTVVEKCVKNGICVSAVPGPCAFVTALAMSGFDSKSFCFEGFWDEKKRRRTQQGLENETRTMIFYEAPHRLLRTLESMIKIFGGEREICTVRELTKIYEQVMHFSLSEAIDYYSENEPRGEFVLVLRGKNECTQIVTEAEADELYCQLISDGLSKSQAAKETAARLGLKKSDIYDRHKED